MPHQCTNCGRTFADGSKEMLSGCPDCSGTKFQFQPEGFDGDDAGPGGDGNESASDDRSDPSTGRDDSASGTGDPTTGPRDGAGTGTVDRTATAGGGDGEESIDDLSPSRSETVSRTVGSAAATVRDLVGGSAGPDATAAQPPGGDSGGEESAPASSDEGADDIIVAESDPSATETDEDAAQADARSGFATADELPGSSESGAADGEAVETGSTSVPESRSASESHSVPESASAPDSNAGPAPGPDPDSRTEVSEPDAETADRPDVAELRKELNEQFESIRVVEPGQYELNLMELYDREEYIIALREDGRYSIQVPETWRDADV